MGVKSTRTITREQAIREIAEHKATLGMMNYKGFSNTYLEDYLEDLNDLVHDGEGFENYMIEEK